MDNKKAMQVLHKIIINAYAINNLIENGKEYHAKLKMDGLIEQLTLFYNKLGEVDTVSEDDGKNTEA